MARGEDGILSTFVSMASAVVSPMLYIVKSWIFWAIILGIIALTFVWFILIPGLKIALFWAGGVIGRLFYGG